MALHLFVAFVDVFFEMLLHEYLFNAFGCILLWALWLPAPLLCGASFACTGWNDTRPPPGTHEENAGA